MAEDMENLTLLYARGMNKSSDDVNDVWDDTALNNAYDKALKMANVEVAKRIAMETNSEHSGNKGKAAKGKARSKPKKESHKSESGTVWKEGMPCRAVYEEDGYEYEAFLIHILDNEQCIVKFLGYDNNEKVHLSSLKQSLGDAARMQQLDDAAREARAQDDGFESQPASSDCTEESSLQEPQHQEKDSSHNKKKKSNKKKSHMFESNYGDMPALPTPNINMFRNMGGAEMTIPPPPPLLALSGRSDAEEQAISDMLLSWYMTGYYTGLYQGMKRQRPSRRYQ